MASEEKLENKMNEDGGKRDTKVNLEEKRTEGREDEVSKSDRELEMETGDNEAKEKTTEGRKDEESKSDSELAMQTEDNEAKEDKGDLDDMDATKKEAKESESEQMGAEKIGDEVVEEQHVYSDGWSKLSREDLIDRIKGIVYGQAIGDALGLATEFMSKVEAKRYYSKKKLSYEVIVQDFHRSRWDKGDWTDDTDQMLLIMLMIIESNGGVNQVDFAGRLYNWMRHGFKELGDFGGMGIGATVSRTLGRPMFCTRPAEAAKEVWEASGRYLAANGAIMRTSILGALSFNDLSRVVSNTVAIAEVTHADPRCKASCVAVTVAIALMLQGNYNLSKKDDINALVHKATEEACKHLEHQPQLAEMKKHMQSSLGDLKLDDRNTIGYTFKALGCGFYGLRTGTDFKKIIIEVIMEGGDADSNAAVCGALLGCKLGFKKLPKDLLELKHKDWMETKVNAFLKVTGLLD